MNHAEYLKRERERLTALGRYDARMRNPRAQEFMTHADKRAYDMGYDEVCREVRQNRT